MHPAPRRLIVSGFYIHEDNLAVSFSKGFICFGVVKFGALFRCSPHDKSVRAPSVGTGTDVMVAPSMMPPSMAT